MARYSSFRIKSHIILKGTMGGGKTGEKNIKKDPKKNSAK